MASKRSLKKQIRYICGDIAAECITTTYLIPQVDKQQLDNAVVKVAQLQAATLAKANISFDKAPRDFDSKADYAKARKEYFAKAYKSLTDHFNKEVEEIVKEMNKALPKKEAK
jgi:hypothetical protein